MVVVVCDKRGSGNSDYSHASGKRKSATFALMPGSRSWEVGCGLGLANLNCLKVRPGGGGGGV